MAHSFSMAKSTSFSFLFANYISDPRSGHYPGAVNIPFSSLFNVETRTLKSIDELKKGE